jgi:hypothetical protein
MRKKHSIVVDNSEKLLLQLFNELEENRYAVYRYTHETAKNWQNTSKMIKRRAKVIIKQKDPLLFPPTTNRYDRIGMLVLPKNVEINIVKGHKKSIINLKKLF